MVNSGPSSPYSFVHSSHALHAYRAWALFCKDTFKRRLSVGGTVKSRGREVVRCWYNTSSYTYVPREQHRLKERIPPPCAVPAGAVACAHPEEDCLTQSYPHSQTRKSDFSGFQSCCDYNMFFSFKFMIHPSSFMQFYFKLKWIIIIIFGRNNFTIPFEVAKYTTRCCKSKAENHCFRASVNWFSSLKLL